jgi:sulfatase modifying factor 1
LDPGDPGVAEVPDLADAFGVKPRTRLMPSTASRERPPAAASPRRLLHALGLFFGWAVLFTVPGLALEPFVISGLGLKLVPIPAGTFTMGSPATEAGRFVNEEPRTLVTISKPFWLGQTEVTHAQWRTIMGTDLIGQVRRMLADDTPYLIAGKLQRVREFYRRAKDSDPGALVYNPDDDAPMYWVRWGEAVAFCRRLTERERAVGRVPDGCEYRLPTEAEWEYACRAGTTTATYAGDLEIRGKFNAPALDAISWYGGNSSVGYAGRGTDTGNMAEKQYPGGIAAPRTVGTRRPNAWGLYDMLGNVYEWCGDWYADRLPGGSVSDPTGPALGVRRVYRGSSWVSTARGSRSADRRGGAPDGRGDDLGFRVALGRVLQTTPVPAQPTIEAK